MSKSEGLNGARVTRRLWVALLQSHTRGKMLKQRYPTYLLLWTADTYDFTRNKGFVSGLWYSDRLQRQRVSLFETKNNAST